MRVHAGRDLRILDWLRRQAMRARGVHHVAQAGQTPIARRRAHNVAADQPVGAARILVCLPLPEHRAEAVGHAFIEAAGIVGIIELQAVLRDAVRELMADHVIALREVDEDRIVAVAIDHLRAVPHRIVEPVAVMDRRHHRHAGIVDGIAVEHGLVEIGDLACFVEGAFGRRLAGISRIARLGFANRSPPISCPATASLGSKTAPV